MKDRENIGPSAKLTELFDSIPSNGDLSHGEMIEKRVKDLGEIFISKYTTPNVDHPGSHEPIARKRLQMGESLYYKNLGMKNFFYVISFFMFIFTLLFSLQKLF